jgi:hypothetical protein
MEAKLPQVIHLDRSDSFIHSTITTPYCVLPAYWMLNVSSCLAKHGSILRSALWWGIRESQ